MGFCPRRLILVCKITPFAPVGLHGCCPELRQEPAQLRVLRKRNSSGKASSDAGPELAGRESCVAMESPQALICPLEKGINKSSSDDRPGPGICDSKYVEDAKAARSVRVWDRVPMKKKVGGIETHGGIENDIVNCSQSERLYDVVGPVCESSDVWGEGRELPYSKRGDILAIRSTGAYGSVMSSRYNLRDLAPAVFSDDLKLK